MRAGIYRGGGIGDNLMAASVLKQLAARYDEVDVLSNKPCHVVFENNPYVTRLITPDQTPIEAAWKANVVDYQKWFEYRGREYDAWFNLNHSCETTVALQSLQTAFWTPAHYRRKLCYRSYIEIVADICDVPYDFTVPLFYSTNAERAQAAETQQRYFGGERFIGWCISGSRLDKIYRNSALAVARLLEEVGPVALFGGPGRDHELANTIYEHCVRATPKAKYLQVALSPTEQNPTWPIRRSLTMMQQAAVVIGPDTGLLWGVAFEQMPKVVLLSHASPENITKHWVNTTSLHADATRVPCWPCHRLHDEISTCTPDKDKQAAACMSDISVDTIVNLAANSWKG